VFLAGSSEGLRNVWNATTLSYLLAEVQFCTFPFCVKVELFASQKETILSPIWKTLHHPVKTLKITGIPNRKPLKTGGLTV